MPKGRHTEVVIAALKQLEAGRKAEDATREAVGVEAHDLCLDFSDVEKVDRERLSA